MATCSTKAITSNQSLERTVDRFAFHFEMIPTHSLRAPRGVVRRRSSSSRYAVSAWDKNYRQIKWNCIAALTKCCTTSGIPLASPVLPKRATSIIRTCRMSFRSFSATRPHKRSRAFSLRQPVSTWASVGNASFGSEQKKLPRSFRDGAMSPGSDHQPPNHTMERTAGSFDSKLSMKFHPQSAATRYPASRRSSCSR